MRLLLATRRDARLLLLPGAARLRARGLLPTEDAREDGQYRCALQPLLDRRHGRVPGARRLAWADRGAGGGRVMGSIFFAMFASAFALASCRRGRWLLLPGPRDADAGDVEASPAASRARRRRRTSTGTTQWQR